MQKKIGMNDGIDDISNTGTTRITNRLTIDEKNSTQLQNCEFDFRSVIIMPQTNNLLNANISSRERTEMERE